MKPLLLLMLNFAFAGGTPPHMVETKTQVELENALSRLVPPQQYLVQVSADVSEKLERRLIEGELTRTPASQPQKKVEIMPGFTPEPEQVTLAGVSPERQIYRMVETPFLESVRVRVDFDDKLPPDRVIRAKNLVKDYLTSHFKGTAVATFGRLPMLVSDPSSALTREPFPGEEWLRKYWAWLVTAFGAWILWLSLRKPTPASNTIVTPQSITKRVRKVLSNPVAAALGGVVPKAAPADPIARKKILLDKFLRKSDSFRLYYQSLSEDKQNELAGLLVGPAFDSLMDGLGIFRSPGKEIAPSNEEECLDLHEREFDDYARARDWQEQQFFGFLHQLSNDQLNTLLTHASPLAACIMLRFLKPAQSAYVLDAMSPSRRQEILAEVPQVQVAALNDLAAIEKEIRASAQRMPRALFGSPKEDADYWGKVLAESDQQEGILKALESTNPELGPNLKKFKFKLEDAMTLKKDILERVLGDVDNDELALALVTLPQKTAEQFLAKLSGRRRDLVASQVLANQTASPAITRPARLSLTKKFRDAMAA